MRSRQLDHYPSGGERIFYLALVVASTIVLYWQQYVPSAVSPSILAHFQISFRYSLTVTVISSAVGAVASLLAGVADRVGRANLVIAGLLVAGLITGFATPAAPAPWVYALCVSAVGFVEGVVLVATPALARDFSTHHRRGRAMGAWALGPVIASLAVAEVASHTLDHLPAWQDQFHIAGGVALGVFAVAAVGLREVPASLRNRVLTSDEAVRAAAAPVAGAAGEPGRTGPWRQMATPKVVLAALGVSVFLLLYYSTVAFFVLYFVSVFRFSQSQANGLANWFWAADAVAVVTAGVLSDRLGVRKPLIVVGTLAGVVLTGIFAAKATEPHTTVTAFAVLVSLLSFSRGFAYAPWMASFTETLEHRNPALIATGLAVWGWTVRLVVSVAFLILPSVVTVVTPIAEYGPKVAALSVTYRSELATLAHISPATRVALAAHPTDTAARISAVTEIAAGEHISAAEAITRLRALAAVPAADRRYLSAHGPAVVAAERDGPSQWQHWWIVCLAGQVLLLPTVFLLDGDWQRVRAEVPEQTPEVAVA